MTRGFRALFLALVVAVAQRDATPAAVGDGEIRGVVVGDEPTPLPIRRAIVTVSGGDRFIARSVLTDDNGRFTVGRLPTGTFSVGVKKAAYLAAAYGAMKPGRQGSEISLGAGQRLSVTITMARGGVISGTLRDESGMPLSGVAVYAIDLHAPGGIETAPAADQMITDDRGGYRFFGLMPSEYVIAAMPAALGIGTVGSRADSEMDALLGELAKRRQNGAPIASVNAPAPLLPTPIAVGFAPVFYPGGATFADAVRIRLAAGEERAGTDFPVIPVPVASVSGTVSGDVANLAAVQLSIASSGPRLLSMPGIGGIIGTPSNAEGRFKFANLTPGTIRIVARARRGATAPSGFSPAMPGDDMLYGVVDVEVRGQDQAGLGITLQPGARLSGRVVFDVDRAPLPADLTKLAVSVSQPGGAFSSSNGIVMIGTALSAVPPVPVRPDGTFEVTGIGPSAYKLACQMPNDLSAVWRLRSAIVDGRDLLDVPLEFAPGQAVRGVVMTLSDKRTEIAGSLQTSGGQPAAAYFVVAFPADRALWKAGPRRLRSTRPATDGRFTFADLPAGTYLIAALTDLDPNDWQDPAFLEQVAPAGVPVVLREGEKKTQDLKIVG
jgi:hypothetical protein